MLTAVDDARSLPGPDWLRARRAAAAERAAALGLPARGDEAWRYGRVHDLDLDSYGPAPLAAPAGGDDAAVAAVVDAVGPRAGLLVVRDGAVERLELDPDLAARGVELVDLAATDAHEPAAFEAPDVFSALNEARSAAPVLLRVPRGVVIEAPVVVVRWVSAAGTVSFPRLLVEAGEQSQVTVVDHAGSDDVAALTVPVLHLACGPSSHVRLLTVEDMGRSVSQLGYQLARVGRQANLVSSTVALGGDYARFHVDAVLEDEGGEAELAAVYFGDGTQTHDFHTLQDHVGRRTSSDLLFKGAVAGTARAVYTGLIRVTSGASGSSAFLTNRNVVLSDGARADSVPNLEIVNENDLKSCGHASATGPIGEDELFYLESRGVPTDVAERLIVLGFFDDLFDRAPVPALRGALRYAVARKFDLAART